MAPPDGHFGNLCEFIGRFLLKSRCMSVKYIHMDGTDSMSTAAYAISANAVVVILTLRARTAIESAAFDDISGTANWV